MLHTEKFEDVQTLDQRKSRNKMFLDSRQEAISLATLIVDEQEQKASKKAQRIKYSVTRSKAISRLEERKEVLAAQINRTKREKAKSRKARKTGDNGHVDNKGKAGKSVTFA